MVKKRHATKVGDEPRFKAIYGDILGTIILAVGIAWVLTVCLTGF